MLGYIIDVNVEIYLLFNIASIYFLIMNLETVQTKVTLQRIRLINIMDHNCAQIILT
jgi:hypothetical protein